MFLYEESNPEDYFDLMTILSYRPYHGITIIPSNYGYIVPFREIILKDIPRMKYFVNYKGIIYNLSRKHFLIGGLDTGGYRQVTLMGYNSRQYNIHVHKLVMDAYGRGPPPQIDDITIDHIDNNKLNNDFRNLQYLPRSINSYKSNITKIRNIPRQTFEDICKYHFENPSVRYFELEKLFGVDQTMIGRFLKGKTVCLSDIYNKYAR